LFFAQVNTVAIYYDSGVRRKFPRGGQVSSQINFWDVAKARPF